MKIIGDLLDHPAAIIALFVSCTALFFTVKNFLRKSGNRLRADISTCSSVDCDDEYIRSITLENLKDKAVVIFTIYLKLGRGNFLIIEDFENKPLILKPFEVYYKEYDPILFYSCSLKQIKLSKVLNNRKIKRRVLLSTTNGKYTVKASTKKWRPESLFFKNYRTAIISPKRLAYKDVSYGGNVKFLVELKHNQSGETTVVSLLNDDYQIKKFNKFQLTRESLDSKEKLEAFLAEQKKLNNLTFDSIKIIDFKTEVKRALDDYEPEPVVVEAHSFFKYNILGRLVTRYKNKKMIEENKKRAKKPMRAN